MNAITDIALRVRRLFQGGLSCLPLPAGLALPLSGAAAVLLSALGYAFYKWHRLSHVPGPFWTPYPFFRLLSRGKLYEEFPALSEKYGKGPISRRHPSHLWVLVTGHHHGCEPSLTLARPHRPH